MGNVGSNAGNGNRHRRQGSHRRQNPPPPPPPQQPPPLPPQQQPPPPTQTTANRYVFAAATPYPAPYANPGHVGGYYQYHPGYYPAPPPPPPATAAGAVGGMGMGMRMPLPAPYDQHHQGGVGGGNWGGRYPCGPMIPAPAPYVEHQKAVTIRNDVNIKKETLRVEPDEENPGKFLVAFTFDATVSGSITVIFFAKEGEDCQLTPTKESILPPVVVHFEQGLGQKFRQPEGTGIDFSMFEEAELMREGDVDVYPLAVKADACPPTNESDTSEHTVPGSTNSQINQAIFVKDKGEFKLKVLKQILWVNGMRYELQEIYGIGNSVEGEFDANDPGKECVICLSEPRDTTVLPCRHMCMCSGCAKVLRFQTNRCPICRQPVERLLEIKVNNGNEEETNT